MAAPPRGWREFCELHAIATARELAGHYRNFAREHPQHDVLPPETFSKQFTSLFQQHFSCEVGKDGAQLQPSTSCAAPHAPLATPLSSQTLTGRSRMTTLSGVQDYREAGRPAGGGALFAVVAPKLEPVVERRDQEEALRRPSGNSLPGNPGLLRGFGSGSIMFHSRSTDDISASGQRPVSELYSSDSSTSNSVHADVTHFSVSQIRQSVRRLFKKRPLPASPTQQDLPSSGPGRNPSPPGDRELSSSSSSSSHSSTCLASEAPPPALSPLSGVASNLLDRFRWFRGGSMRQKRSEAAGCCKEGHLRYLLVDDTISDSQPRWQRCRLLVRRISDAAVAEGEGVRARERYQLELYDPPKASSPKLKTRCADIQEVRRCNRLEMPDNLNTFVLKVNGDSLIFETDNDQQVSSWTTEIKECISNRSGSVDLEPLPSPADTSVPPGHRGTSETESPTSISLPLPEQGTQKTYHFLFSYPWFHGPISRVKAAHLVQNSGPQGHGVFLVRQSETRKGDYVLTFNYQGKAKHLRLSLTEWGQCRVQHLRFPSVMDMLSHFRVFPIPLECGDGGAVTLSSFVVAGSGPPPQGQVSAALLVPFLLHRWNSEPSLAHWSSSPPSSSSSPATPAPAPSQRASHPPPPPPSAAAPLRRSESVGRRPQLRHGHPPFSAARDSDYELEPERSRKRAIENQYMLL